MQSAAFFESLAHVLPADGLLIKSEDTKPYECDGLTMFKEQPLAVCLPTTEQQIVEVINICRRFDIPVVPRGAGTGLSGGAVPMKQGIVLSTARLNKIVSIDPTTRSAVVQPGVRNLAVSEAVAHLGLYYAPDPSSQIACSIGGNVAENSGGVHCLKYGLTVHNIKRVRVVLSTGEIVEIGGDALDAPGYDLLACFIGSEGLLGIATEVTVKLTPKPALAQVAMASFDSVETAGAAVGKVIAAGIIPGGMEMQDQMATAAVEDFVHAGYDLNAAAILLVESDGTPEEVKEEMTRIDDVLRAAGATDVKLSTNEAERLRYWSGRKNAFPAVGRISPDYYCMDGTIPRKALPQVLRGIESLSQKYGLRCANVFHAGDGNLHPLILYDANTPGESEKTEQFGAEILELCVQVGGTITGEHGVGIEKINQMCSQFTPKELLLFHGVKKAWDEAGVMNPNKHIPTLHRCAEHGRMHVNSMAGGGKFEGLERY
jgi:glycolate oxidase